MQTSLPFLVPDERIALFIDANNFNATLRALDAEVDFRKMRRLFDDNARLLRAHYYALVPQDGFNAIAPLLDWLTYNGYTVIRKQLRGPDIQAGHTSPRGSIAIELAIDALQTARQVDTILLLTGDARYRALVEAIQMQGVRVLALSTRVVRPPLISDELRRQVDEFIELADLLPEIRLERAARKTGYGQ